MTLQNWTYFFSFWLKRPINFFWATTIAVCAGSHSTNVFLYPHVDAEQISTPKSVTMFYILVLCFSAFDLYYNWFG